MLVPLYGFLQGDTVGLLVLVQDTDSVSEVALVLQQAASVRVKPGKRGRVLHLGIELDATMTVAQAGLTALERVDVILEET